MKHYLIYEIKNNLNGMIYVGKHVTDDINDSYMGSGIRILYAIEKYGIENFEKTILFECSSEEEMNKKEAEIVNEDFIARDDVYNIKLGGEGGWDEVNKNPNNVGINHWFKNKTPDEQAAMRKRGTLSNIKRIKNMSKDEYEKMREFHRQVSINWCKQHPDFHAGKNNPMFGKHHSSDACKKMSESHKGKKNNQYGKMWICNDKTHESKTILKSETIPDGWRKGRICKK